MRKKLCLAAVTGLLLISGCSSEVSTGGSENSSAAVDIEKAASEIVSEVEFEDTLTELEEATALTYYGIASEDVSDSVVMISTGATAEELAIFQASDASKAEDIKAACEARQDKQITSYNDYRPSEVGRLEDAIIDVYGNYVVYCVVDDVDKAEEILEGYFK